jgi:hypothetical protein
MSRSILSSLLLALLAIFASQCKQHNDLNQTILTGKLVVSDPCGLSAIQVLSGQIDPSRVTASWTDPDNDSVYNNVFKVGGTDIYCNLAAYGLGKGDSLQFELDNNPPKMVCFTCNDANPPSVPPIYNAIKNVKKLSSVVPK